MKAIILLLSVSAGSLLTLANLSRLTSMKDQVVAALPKLEESAPSTPVPSDVPAPTSSLADVVSQYGEPQRKERAMNGTTVYYYPYTIIYIQNNRVVASHPVASAQAAQAPAPNTTGQRFWGANNNNSAVNITATGTSPVTGKVGWQAQNSSLGSASLNGSGPTVTRSANGGWQGTTSSAPAASAPRTVSVVRPSAGAGMYRSTGGGSTGSSQWH